MGSQERGACGRAACRERMTAYRASLSNYEVAVSEAQRIRRNSGITMLAIGVVFCIPSLITVIRWVFRGRGLDPILMSALGVAGLCGVAMIVMGFEHLSGLAFLKRDTATSGSLGEERRL